MSAVRSLAGWRPNTPFYYGWLILGVAALGAFAATGVAQVVLGGHSEPDLRGHGLEP